MDETTSVFLQSIHMFVLDAGLGLVMQVITIISRRRSRTRLRASRAAC